MTLKIGTTGPIGTNTITNNPGKKYEMYYNSKTDKYEVKAIDVIKK